MSIIETNSDLTNFVGDEEALFGSIQGNLALDANTKILNLTGHKKVLTSDNAVDMVVSAGEGEEVMQNVEVTKDMAMFLYTDELDPIEYKETLFPDLSDFIEANIVLGNKESSELIYYGSVWDDLGDDIFDDWGYFFVYDVSNGQYFLPILDPMNADDGVITTQTFTAFDGPRTFTMKHGWSKLGVFKIELTVDDDLPFRFGGYGNMGSDGDQDTSALTHGYSKYGHDGLTLYYNKDMEEGNDIEILYTYVVPRKLSENTGNVTYDVRYQSGNMSMITKPFTKGITIYFSKTNDEKTYVVSDIPEFM